MAQQLKCVFQKYPLLRAQKHIKIQKKQTMSLSHFSMFADLSFYRDGEIFLGEIQIRLLKQVVTDGSIHAAAKNLKISYQHAWHLLDKVNRLSPIPVIIRQKGGKDGGGCTLSHYGLIIIQMYEKKVSDIALFLKQTNSDFKNCFF